MTTVAKPPAKAPSKPAVRATPSPAPANAPVAPKTGFRLDMKASPELHGFLEAWEGFEPRPYRCSAGVWTIGIGHAMPKGPNITLISREGAYKLLAEDLARFERELNPLVKVPLEQHEYDALLSLVFNVGVGKADGVKGDIADSTLLAKLNKGDKAGAAAEFEKWHYSNGKPLDSLRTRRLDEARMFTSGSYTRTFRR